MVKYDVNSKIGRDHGSGAWSDSTYLRFEPKDFLLLKELKSSIYEESGYIEKLLVWKEEDNVMPTEHIATLVHFMTKLVDFTPEFIKKHNVKDYHINLIRRMYIEHDDYEDKMALMGFKRPYGNSHVIGDVFEEYEKSVGQVIKFEDLPKDYIKEQEKYYDDGITDDIKDDIVSEYVSEYWMDENHDFLLNIHIEVMNILEAMTKELELKSLEWVSNNDGTLRWNVEWTPTEKGKQQYNSLKREVKLERILKD